MENNTTKLYTDMFERIISSRVDAAVEKMLAERDPRGTALYVSGLRKEVKKSDIHRYFPGCQKVLLKQCRIDPHLK